MSHTWAILAALLASVDAKAPPNPFLADSSWPTAHCDSYATDNSALSVPGSADSLRRELVGHSWWGGQDNSFQALTFVWSADHRWIWGTSISSILLYEVSEGNLRLADIYFQGADIKYHGAYSFVSVAGVYYSSGQAGFRAYRVDEEGKIQPAGSFAGTGFGEDESVIGVQMSYDGHIVFATSTARVGVLTFSNDETFELAADILDLRLEGEDPTRFISNSFSLDEHGGIYFVSATALYRVQWNASSTSKLALTWRTPYSDGQDPQHVGRLGSGVGSTPSIMTQESGKQHVVVSDGLLPMNVLVFDTETGDITGNKTVNFVNGELAQSEQSTVVSDQRVVVVQNNFPTDRISSWCNVIPDTGLGACPFLTGTMPYFGVQQFRVSESGELTETWTNLDFSCASSIPAVAAQGSGKTMLCVGHRPRTRWSIFGWFLPRNTYTVESLDWETGEEVFSVEIGTGAFMNPLYAEVQVGGEQDILFGTLGGVARLSPGSADNYELCRSPLGWLACTYNIPGSMTVVIALLLSLIVSVAICCCRCSQKKENRSRGNSTELAPPLVQQQP